MIDEKVLIERLKDEERDYRRRWKYKGENEEDWLCMEAMQKAIGFVEQLAEEHNKDFCEWKEDGVFYNIDCKGKEYICTAISEFEFCPYCGKKIKVVE